MNESIDGNRITSGLSVFFLWHYRQLVEAGKLYKLMPPLYKITKNKKAIYLDDNRAYAEYVQNDIVKNMTIYALRDGEQIKLKNSEILELILSTKDYYDGLKRCATNALTDTMLFEYILMNIYLIEKNDLKKFVKNLKKYSRDLDIIENAEMDEIIISGVYNMDTQFVRINKKFMKKVRKLVEYLNNDNNDKYFVVNDRKVQLFELLEIFDSYKPADRQRYKGLGEMTPAQLDETSLRPGQRRLVQLTIGDLEKTIETFEVLHGKKPKMVAERKKLMSKFKINIDDIDS